jgi:hypothetical protein
MNQGISFRTVLGLSVALCLGLAVPGMAKLSGGTTTGCSSTGGSGRSFNVTSNIFNSSTSTPFQLQNDGNSQYATYKNSRTDSVTSEIQQNSCDWVLDLSNSQSRSVQLSLGFPVSSGVELPAGWPADGSLVNIPALVMTNCGRNSANGSTSVGNMTFAGQTLQCGLHVTFYSGGIQYSLRMNASTWPGATWGQVTCTNAASNLCNVWTVTPGVDANGSAVTDPYTQQSSGIGELVQPSCDGCAGGTPVGLYYVSFSATITKP